MATAPKTTRKATDKTATKPAGAATTRKPKSGPQQAAGLSATDALDKSRKRLTGGAPAGAEGGEGTKVTEQPADANSTVAGGQIVTEQDGTLRGGAKKVKIEVMPVLSRGGLNVQREEDYPFNDLPFSEVNGRDIIGPSFFIPKSDNPDQKVATARKRFRGKPVQFITRKTSEVVEEEKDLGKQPGVRVWKVEGRAQK